MPYRRISELPNHVRKLPEIIQRKWMSIWNSVFEETKSEERAFKAANAILSKEKKMKSVYYLATTAPDKWIQVLRTGKFKHPVHGKINITEKMLDEMVVNFKNGKGEIVIDYRHGSVQRGGPEDGKAAGWARSLERRGGELWASPDWTDQAKTYIEKGEYRYTSAEFHHDDINVETGKKQGATLRAIAITNRPFVGDMAPMVLSEDMDLSELNPIAMEVIDTSNKGGGREKNNSKEVKQMEALKKLAEDIGLKIDDGLDEAGIAKALQEYYKKSVEKPDKEKILELAKAEGLKLEEIAGEAVIKLEDGREITDKDFIEMEKQTSENTLKLELMEAEKRADTLIQEKKILPKERDLVIKLALQSDAKLLEEFLSARDDGTFVKLFEAAGGSGPGKDREEGEKTGGEKFLEAIAEKQKEDKKLSYSDAMQSVILEEPELAAAYNEEQLT